ncbi:MAG: hypothetical protein ACP5UV_00265 [Thermoplasmata archaeon]
MGNGYTYLIKKAEALEKIGRYPESARVLDRMIEAGYVEKDVIIQRISVYYKMGLFEDALDFIKKYEGNPLWDEVRLWKILILSETGQARSIIDELSKPGLLTGLKTPRKFEIPEAETFYQAVSLAIIRFPKWYWSDSGLNPKVEIGHSDSENRPGGWIDGLYTDFFDSIDVRIPHVNHYLRAIYFYSAGRLGDSLIEISCENSHPVYKEYLRASFMKRLKKIEDLDDDYSKSVGYHLLRMKEESLRAIDRSLERNKDEVYSYSKKIIYSTNNSITSSVFQNILQE